MRWKNKKKDLKFGKLYPKGKLEIIRVFVWWPIKSRKDGYTYWLEKVYKLYEANEDTTLKPGDYTVSKEIVEHVDSEFWHSYETVYHEHHPWQLLDVSKQDLTQ